eukprot:592701-Prymnesium_polylepis.1
MLGRLARGRRQRHGGQDGGHLVPHLDVCRDWLRALGRQHVPPPPRPPQGRRCQRGGCRLQKHDPGHHWQRDRRSARRRRRLLLRLRQLARRGPGVTVRPRKPRRERNADWVDAQGWQGGWDGAVYRASAPESVGAVASWPQ